MTHYMGLLAANQPWNLLLFMAIPVILAESLAITELALLFKPDAPRLVRALNRRAGLVARCALGTAVGRRETSATRTRFFGRTVGQRDRIPLPPPTEPVADHRPQAHHGLGQNRGTPPPLAGPALRVGPHAAYDRPADPSSA